MQLHHTPLKQLVRLLAITILIQHPVKRLILELNALQTLSTMVCGQVHL